jgi:hypothetical protein
MADFPQRRVDDGELGPEQALARQVRGDAGCIFPAGNEVSRQLLGVR